MPGIVGIVGRNTRGENEGLLTLMLERMMHEPFYVGEAYINEELGLWLGSVNQEGSFADCLRFGMKRRISAFFSRARISPTRRTSTRLEGRGHEFGSEDASYLVHLYEERGCEFLERLNGWFSGVLVDLREQKVVLFNDRYGVNRIYYHEDAHGFYFSSEAKSLLKVLPGTRQT